MIGPDRRRTPRTTLERYAYINIEPNNGGIVLNVSDGGLCFHSFDPVPRNEKVRFWFWDHNRRIDADGELAWMDETQKGGLRFTVLSADAREHIRNWMGQPEALPAAGEGAARSAPSPRIFPALSATRPEAKVSTEAPAVAATLPEVRVRIRLRGFSGGLVTGLMVSLLVTVAFLFPIYRSQIGESLIRLGERFAAKPQAQSPTVVPSAEAVLAAGQDVSPSPQAVSPAAQVSQPSLRSVAPSAAATSVPTAEKILPPPVTTPDKPQPAKIVSLVPAGSALTVAGNPPPKPPVAASTPEISVVPPALSVPLTAKAPDFSRVPGNLAVAPPPTPAPPPDVHAEESKSNNADATSEMFFEVGRYKDKRQAHNTSEKLAQLGFPANTVQKNHLWSGSYHVLVGPYEDDEEATSTHKNLVSYGFKPRPFERGSRDLTFRSGMKLNGTPIPVGEYTVSWESYVSDAVVKFVHDNSTVTTAGGRWVKRDVKYDVDAYMYRRNADGSRTLLEIRFAGMRQALDLAPAGPRFSR